jgi:hypothetical protein
MGTTTSAVLEKPTDGEPEKPVSVEIKCCVVTREEQREAPLGTHRFQPPCFDQCSWGEKHGVMEAMRTQGLSEESFTSILTTPRNNEKAARDVPQVVQAGGGFIIKLPGDN